MLGGNGGLSSGKSRAPAPGLGFANCPALYKITLDCAISRNRRNMSFADFSPISLSVSCSRPPPCPYSTYHVHEYCLELHLAFLGHFHRSQESKHNLVQSISLFRAQFMTITLCVACNFGSSDFASPLSCSCFGYPVLLNLVATSPRGHSDVCADGKH